MMKSVMSGQRIPSIHHILSSWEIFCGYLNGTYGNAEETLRIYRGLRETIRTYIKKDIKEMCILDFGCGQIAKYAALFKSDGADITGIDVEIPTYKMDLNTFIRIIKINGIERAIKSLIRHLLFDRQFFLKLSSLCGKTILPGQLDIRAMDGTTLTFPDTYFDVVYSAYVFEHIENVEQAIKQINRVLKPSRGIAWISIHLFPSLSGGHHIAKHIPPWDHLGDNRYPVNTYLNKLNLKQYRDIFRKHIDIIKEKLTYEGENALTSELEKNLSRKQYTRQDLLTKTVTFICKKAST